MKRKPKTALTWLRSSPWAIVPFATALVFLLVAEGRDDRSPGPPQLSVSAGFHDEPFELVLSSDTPGATIRYTLDGSIPTMRSSSVYEGPLRIASTTVLRAAAFKFAASPSQVETATYLFPEDIARQPAEPEGYPDRWRSSSWGAAKRSTRARYAMDSGAVEPPSRYVETVGEALRSLPTLSIVADVEEIFGPKGIYANPRLRGMDWERAVSAEFFGTDGALRFRQNCGLRISGNGGFEFRKFPKRGFRLCFRARYGVSRLRFPLFGGHATETFDTVLLRPVSHDSWHYAGRGTDKTATYIRDQFVRELQAVLGHPSIHGSFVHLYINGLYWGMYNMCERPDEAFVAAYLGGNESQCGVLKPAIGGIVHATADAWREVDRLSAEGIETESIYRVLQAHVDVGNLIDYLILNHYIANEDWARNWVAARTQESGGRFVLLAWDSEIALRDVEANWEWGEWTNNHYLLQPRQLGERLMRNEEFRSRFSDRVQALCLNDGPLTPAAATRLWQSVAQRVDSAIVAESARWGRHFRGKELYSRDRDWVREVAKVEDSFLPRRRDILLDQYREAGVFPVIDAPAFNQHGGLVPSGFALEIRASGAIYYTLDGADPRLPGGAVNDGHAVVYDGPIALTQETHVKARAHDGEVWSTLCQSTFSIESVETGAVTAPLSVQ